MTHHRTTISTAALLLAFSAAIPASAVADPLLSGYGGPGLGSQAILGSTLLGGPENGGGGSAGGGAGATLSAAEPSAGSGRLGATAGAGIPAPPRAAASGSTAAGRGRRAAGAIGRPPGGVSGLYPASERGAATSSGTLGLSGRDLAYILLTFCALVVTGAIMRRLTPKTAARRHG